MGLGWSWAGPGVIPGSLLEQMWPLTVQSLQRHAAFRAISKWLLNSTVRSTLIFPS